MKRCIKKTAQLFLWMLIGLVIGALLYSLSHQVYGLLYKYMPNAFPMYSSIFEEEKYTRFINSISLISFSLTLFITTYICQRYNNDRFECIISKTDGLYRISAVLKTYVCNYGMSDLVASVICGVAFTLPLYFIPHQFFSSASIIAEFLSLGYTVTRSLGSVGSALFGVAALALSHALSLPLVLKYYRAKWLTGFAEGTV